MNRRFRVYRMFVLFLFFAQTARAVTSQLDLGVRVYQSALKVQAMQQSSNFVISPYAMDWALAMLAASAHGRTQTQLSRNPLSMDLKTDAYKLILANRLWVHLGFPLLESSMLGLERQFGIRPWMVDFSKAPDFLSDRVNGWLAERTQGKVKKMITEDSVDPSMRMLLTSSLYFKADWASPWSRAETDVEDFYTPSKKQHIPFLHKKGIFRSLKIGSTQLVELPFKNSEISMILLVPKKMNGLSRLGIDLNEKNMNLWLSQMTSQELELSLPKFKVDVFSNLKAPLQMLDMSDAFQAEVADFSTLNGARTLFLSAFYQQIAFELNEEGVETLSKNSSRLGRASEDLIVSLSDESSSIRVNHPFIFLIWNRATQSALFLGQVFQPLDPRFSSL